MKKRLERFRTEDWIIVAAGMLILVLSLAAPGWMPRMPEKFATPADAAKGLGLYLFLLVLTAGCQRLLRRPAGGGWRSRSLRSSRWPCWRRPPPRPGPGANGV